MDNAFFKLLKEFLYNLFAYCVGLLGLLIITPFLSFTLTPFIVYRRLLFYSAKYFRPDLGKMLNASGNITLTENVYKSGRCQLVVALILEGCPTPDDINAGVKSAMETIDPKTGDKLYPELTQNLSNWMGYWFWKPVTNFSVKDHVDYINNFNEPISFEKADSLIKEESLVPFEKDKALWKVKLFTNYIPHESDQYAISGSQYSLVVFSVHHCLVDGVSLMQLMHKMFQANTNELSMSNDRRLNLSLCRNAQKAFVFPLKLPLDVGVLILNQSSVKNIWKLSGEDECHEIVGKGKSPLTKAASYNLRTSGIIDFERIKNLRKIHGVTSMAVIVAAITGSIRNSVFKDSTRIPRGIHFYYPVPLPNHPDKLRNHMSAVGLSIPVGEIDPLKRLLLINQTILKLKQSTLPIVTRWLSIVFGCLPTVLLRMMIRSSRKANMAVLSSFPGPRNELKSMGVYGLKDLFWTCNVLRDTKKMGFLFTTYAGYARLSVSADSSVLQSDQKAVSVIDGFFSELDVLERLGHESETV